MKKLINRTIYQWSGNPAFARAVGKPLVTPLDIRYRLKAGAHSNGRRVAVADVLNERLRLELDNAIGGKLAAHLESLPERCVTIGTRPLAITIPNPHRPAPELWTPDIPASLDSVPLGIAYGWTGRQPVYWDRTIDSNAHILVAGITGSGKTVMLRAILLSLAAHCAGVEFVGIDLKGLGFAPLAGLFSQSLAISKPDALALLMAVDAEISRRVETGQTQPALVLAIDELIDLTEGDSQAQEWLYRITRKGRELNIIVVAGMQKPLIDEIGQAKSQFGVRVVGRMRTRKEAETAAGVAVDADSLMHAGTFYLVGGIGQPVLFRGLYPEPGAVAAIAQTYQPIPSVLRVRQQDADSGKEAVQALVASAQAEEDAERLLEEFGDSVHNAGWNERIRALGLTPSGNGYRTGKERVIAALNVLTSISEVYA